MGTSSKQLLTGKHLRDADRLQYKLNKLIFRSKVSLRDSKLQPVGYREDLDGRIELRRMP